MARRTQIKMDDQGWPVHEESFAVQAGQEVRPPSFASCWLVIPQRLFARDTLHAS